MIKDAVGGLNTANPANVTLTGIEKVTVDTVGTLGKNAVAAVDAVAQSNQYVFSAFGTGSVVGFTYGTTAGTFTASSTATAATNFAAALNNAVGTTSAFVGTAVANATVASGSKSVLIGTGDTAIKAGMAERVVEQRHCGRSDREWRCNCLGHGNCNPERSVCNQPVIEHHHTGCRYC